MHFAKTHVLDDIILGESTFSTEMLKSLLGVSWNGVCTKKYKNVIQLLPAFLKPQKKVLESAPLSIYAFSFFCAM